MTREIVIRISVPDGMEAPQVDYVEGGEPPHPSGSGAQCKHGQMVFKQGTSKAGKDYKGYFCSEDQCKPVWA